MRFLEKIIISFIFLSAQNTFSETIISLKYDASKSERNSIIAAANKINTESFPIHSVSTFRNTTPKLATVVIGPFDLKENTFMVNAVDCRKKYGLWRCEEATSYKFMYFGEIAKSIRIDKNIDYEVGKKIIDFSKTTNCYPRNWPDNLAVDHEGLQFSESLEKLNSNEEYILQASGCALTLSLKNELISIVHIEYAP